MSSIYPESKKLWFPTRKEGPRLKMPSNACAEDALGRTKLLNTREDLQGPLIARTTVQTPLSPWAGLQAKNTTSSSSADADLGTITIPRRFFSQVFQLVGRLMADEDATPKKLN